MNVEGEGGEIQKTVHYNRQLLFEKYKKAYTFQRNKQEENTFFLFNSHVPFS